MGVSERKQRDREGREALIVSHAGRLLVERGFQALNLDTLADQVEYSKGTLYQHFSSKEDLALAVATRALKERADLFERATRFEGRSRERMRAIGFACCQFAVAHPDYFQVELMLKAVSFWDKASDLRRQAHSAQALRCFEAGHGIVREAMEVGDLPGQNLGSEKITFGLIAVTMGSHVMVSQPDLQRLCGITDPIEMVRRNQDLFCDGLGWRPLLRDWDYGATDQRIRATIFPEATWLGGAL